ncbi:hypothetical protein Tco_0673650 [Tanacetum coccineum]
MSRANPQETIVSEEQLVLRANKHVIKKANHRITSDSAITDTMLRFVVEILRHHKLYKPVSLTATVPIIYLHQFWTIINHNPNNHTFTFELDTHTFTLTPGLLRTVLQMSPFDPNNTYAKPPPENQILGFIKTLGYDEDPDTKMIIVAKIVATRSPVVKDPTVQSLLDLWKGSKATRLESLKQKKQAVTREGSSNAHNKHYADSDTDNDAILYSSCSEERENETDDADAFDMDLSDDNPDREAGTLTNFNVFKAFEKAVQARVLIEIKKLLPTHIPKAVANYVRPRLNISVLDVMKNNQINLFTQSSTSTDDLLKMDLKLKLLNRIHLNKLNGTHNTHRQLYDTLYESITLDQDALNAQNAEPSFHKRSHNNQDPPNNCKGEQEEKKKGCWVFEALNGIHHWEDGRIDFFKAEMSTKIEGSVYYADFPRLSLNDVKDMYLLKVKDKLHHLPLEFVKDFNNALLLFIRRVVIQNKVEDIQLGVESYQQTLDLTKLMMFFKGIDQRIPFIMTTTHKGVVYLNQQNVKSLMRLSEVKKLCDGTLEKIRENLIDMVTKNKLGKGSKRLKGRDWTDDDVVKSKKMVKNIDQTLKRREQLRRLEEYVGGRSKTVNPRTFVRPM